MLNCGPLQCWDCIIAWLPESSLNRHFLSLRATINQPFTHPSTQHFCHQYTSLPPSTGALGPSQTHEYNQCKPQLFATPVLLSFSLFFLVVDWGPHCNKALNKFRAPRRLSGSGRCLQLQCYWDPSPVITHKAFFSSMLWKVPPFAYESHEMVKISFCLAIRAESAVFFLNIR